MNPARSAYALRAGSLDRHVDLQALAAYDPSADGVRRRFISQTADNNAAALERLVAMFAHARQPIGEAGYEGQTYVSPGGSYTGTFYPVEFLSGMLDVAPEWYSSDELFAMADWLITKQIADDDTTYTRPYSGGTDTYAIGTMPDYVPADGNMASGNPYITQGDKPVLSNAFGATMLAYHWGRSCGWDATWAAWFSDNAAVLAASIDSVPYNDDTGLVTQHAGAYKAVSLHVLSFLDGDHYVESCWACEACRQLAQMHYRLGSTSTALSWVDRANTIRDSIRAAFVTVTPMWDALNETYVGYARGAGVPPGHTTFSSGAGGTAAVIVDPDDATNNLLQVSHTGGGGAYYGLMLDFVNNAGLTIPEPYMGKHTRIFTRAKVSTTTANWSALRADTGTVGPNIYVLFASDGHFKYYNGSGTVNLPVDTTYTANTWYTLEARLIWGSTNTAQIFINGVSKGTIAILNPSVRIGVVVYGYDGGAAGVATYDYYRWSAVPDVPITGPCGYLPWATGPYGKQFSPLASALAAYLDILTPDQAVAVGRYLDVLRQQPAFETGSAQQRQLFSNVTNYRHYVRWTRWADDWLPGSAAAYPIIPAISIDYGAFIDGGYMDWGWVWMLRALSLANPGAAATMLAEMIEDVVAAGTDAPWEHVNAGTLAPGNYRYLQGAVALYGTGRV